MRFVLVLAVVVLARASSSPWRGAQASPTSHASSRGAGSVRDVSARARWAAGFATACSSWATAVVGRHCRTSTRSVNGGLPARAHRSRRAACISGTPTRRRYGELLGRAERRGSSVAVLVRSPKTADREFSITINPGFRIDNAVTSKYWTLSQAKSEQLDGDRPHESLGRSARDQRDVVGQLGSGASGRRDISRRADCSQARRRRRGSSPFKVQRRQRRRLRRREPSRSTSSGRSRLPGRRRRLASARSASRTS